MTPQGFGETKFLNRNSDLLCFVVGIGININNSELPSDFPSTSYLIETGVSKNIEEIVSSLSTHFQQNLTDFMNHGFASFLESYRQELSLTDGDLISFHVNGKKLNGYFKGITDTGTLMLENLDGTIGEYS